VGVFLGPGQPDLNPTPLALDFSTAASQDYAALSPDLQQAFFMGVTGHFKTSHSRALQNQPL
jgi:hypothetical protein